MYGLRRMDLLRAPVAATIADAIACCTTALPHEPTALGTLARDMALYLGRIGRAERQVRWLNQ
jgi:hypothetical protein